MLGSWFLRKFQSEGRKFLFPGGEKLIEPRILTESDKCVGKIWRGWDFRPRKGILIHNTIYEGIWLGFIKKDFLTSLSPRSITCNREPYSSLKTLNFMHIHSKILLQIYIYLAFTLGCLSIEEIHLTVLNMNNILFAWKTI